MTIRRTSLIATFAGGLLLVALIDNELFVTLISLALVAAPAINLIVAFLLRLAVVYAEPDVPVSLRARVADGDELWVASSLGAVLGLNRLLTWNLPLELVLATLAAALLLITVPAIDWLWTWRHVVMAALRAWTGRGPEYPDRPGG